MSVIDTFVPGTPSDVKAAAEFLDPSLRSALEYSENAGSVIPVSVRSHWYGASADHYVSLLIDISEASDELRGFARDGAEKLRAYAGQLERMQNDFAGHRDRAASDGLSVSGNTISAPVPPTSYVVTERDDPHWDAWQRYQDRVKTYNRIAEDVGSWWGELEMWVHDNLDTFAGTIPTDSALKTVLDGLTDASADIPKEYIGYQGDLWKENANFLTKEGERLRAEAADWVRKLRSGNPAVRAAAEAANPHGLRWQASEVEEMASRLGKTAKWVPGIGWVLDGVDFIKALEGDGSPSSVGIEVIAGTAGGVVGGIAVGAGIAAAGLTAPLWVPVAAGAAIAIGVGAGAVWAYESWVPQDVREAIDAGLRDGWDATTDFAEDAWDNTTEFVGDVGHNIGKAWDGLWN
ncbi:hypothetical protein [Microbacterium sp. NC79]|uniref:hypothetical protein n=1 Tax=Microbacterium sp. NC79 TaxID=2851009 RepID=UPI001C2C7761|nr:hypothetical protein [Microbacterium sp. NC79]MBV0893715.1 hypothetical protein [Microbacterium sp. NC79]